MPNLKVKSRGLWAMEETTFATDPDASGATYKYIHGYDISLPVFSNEILQAAYQNDTLTVSAADVGVQKASISFKAPLRASGTPGSAAPAIAGELDIFLKHLTGTVTRGTGTTVAGGNASNINLLVAASAGFTIGMAVYCTATSEMRIVSAIPDGTHVTLDAALASTPTTGNIVASNLYTPALSGHKSIAIATKVDSLLVTLLGGRFTAKLGGLTATGRPEIEISGEFDSFSLAAKGSLPAADDLFPTVKPQILKGCPFFSDATQTKIMSAEFDFGQKPEWSEATEGAQGRGGFEVTERMPKGSYEPFYAAGLLTDFQAGTTRELALLVGNQNNGWALWVKKAQALAHELQAKNGQLANKVPFQVVDNGSLAEYGISVF